MYEYKEDRILPQSLDNWKKLFESDELEIYNEYEDLLTMSEMLSCITDRSWSGKRARPPTGYPSLKQFYADNCAEPGPMGLLRHRIERGHCIGHGEGTYDLIVGEFS